MSGLNIISLGMGVQSVAMYLMSCMGELPLADYAVFADTGREKSKTLDSLAWLQNWRSVNNGIPIFVMQEKNLFKDLLNQENSTGGRFSSIPAFTNTNGEVGMLRRQCTNEYKIEQVDKAIRKIYGLAARKHMPAATIWKGITVDEIERLSIPQEKWKTYYYPFCGYSISKKVSKMIDTTVMSRTDIVSWYHKNNFPVPVKSSCVFCPFQSDASWYELKKNSPKDFQDAVLIDDVIRNSSKKGIQQPVYLHKSLKPLSQVEFKYGDPDLWNGECSDNCHL